MVLLSCSGTGGGIYAKLAKGMARYNCARASPTRNSSVLRSLARRQQAPYPQVTHRQGSGRMTRKPEGEIAWPSDSPDRHPSVLCARSSLGYHRFLHLRKGNQDHMAALRFQAPVDRPDAQPAPVQETGFTECPHPTIGIRSRHALTSCVDVIARARIF
jgi:hypothetical protein